MQTLLEDYYELRRAIGLPDSLTHNESVSNARMMWQTLQSQDKAISDMNKVLRDMMVSVNSDCGKTESKIEVRNG